VSTYVGMRKAGFDPRSTDRRITATTRQLESMFVATLSCSVGSVWTLRRDPLFRIRMSEAHARMRFSQKVEAADVQEAARLIREALKESSTDPTTGLIDVDLLLAGQSNRDRKLRGDLRREVLNLLETMDASNKGMRWTEVVKALEGQSAIPVDQAEFSEVVRALEKEGTVKLTGGRETRTIRRLGAADSAEQA
jgi:DNA replication licensing factor MCM4